MARASKEDTTISSKRWIMAGMLGTRSGLAMKKTAENFSPVSLVTTCSQEAGAVFFVKKVGIYGRNSTLH
jgi:hypothetical protein